jgi:Calcium/calmodulin dependent protein kinase II association domain
METELLDLTRQLLNAIAERDWATYEQLCDPSLTCFEPESLGHLVEGMPFHKFYFEIQGGLRVRNTTLTSPQVRSLGPDAAVVSYVRLIQKIDDNGNPASAAVAETRIWQRIDGKWKHVHFHRSEPGH